jgi:hypothetical protein
VNFKLLLNPAFLVAFGIMGTAAIGMQAALDHYKIYLQKKPIYPEPIAGKERILRALPTETARWRQVGADRIESAEGQEELGTANYLTRVYAEKSADGAQPRRVELHAAYYTGMIDTVPHVPERCFTGGGATLIGGPWELPLPLEASDWVSEEDNPFAPAALYTTRLSNEYSTAGGGRRVRLPIGVSPDNPPRLRITEYSGGGDRSFFAGYFFIANGGLASSAEQVRGLAFDLQNDYAYYLKVQFNSPEAANAEELAATAAALLDDLFGELMTCTPDWSKVQQGQWPPDNPKAQTRAGLRP